MKSQRLPLDFHGARRQGARAWQATQPRGSPVRVTTCGAGGGQTHPRPTGGPAKARMHDGRDTERVSPWPKPSVSARHGRRLHLVPGQPLAGHELPRLVRPVLQRLGQPQCADVLLAGEVRDRPRHPQRTMYGAR